MIAVDVLIGVGLLLMILVTTLGAMDSRDGRDWQPRGDWQARREGD